MLQRVPREWWGDCGERVLGLMVQELRKLDKQRSEQNKIRHILAHGMDFKPLLASGCYASVYVLRRLLIEQPHLTDEYHTRMHRTFAL